jgi:hypothetical protein
VDFRCERHSNAAHQSTTDPEALLALKGKGKEAKLCYSANALVENRNSLLIEFHVAIIDAAEIDGDRIACCSPIEQVLLLLLSNGEITGTSTETIIAVEPG